MKKILFVFGLIVLVWYFAVSGIGFQKKEMQTISTSSSGAISQRKTVIPSVFAKTPEMSIKVAAVSSEKKLQTVSEPLVSFSKSGKEAGVLKSADVVLWTNEERVKNNLPPLTRNSQLDTAAIIKVHDMFAHQYFEHTSPNGKNAADLVSGAGYEYLWVGENLALGIFESEKALVDAWMGSPGHRANILNSHFEEIGVAVDEGEFGGKHVWLAVQEFGKPSSSCPSPEKNLKTEIEQNQSVISSSAIQASGLLDEVTALEKWDNNTQYNAKVTEYNTVVEALNILILKTRKLAEAYNAEIKTFNDCVGTK